jgi:hypothetical protein
MSKKLTLENAKRDLAGLEGREIGTYLYTALNQGMESPVRQYLDIVIRDYYSGHISEFDTWAYDRIKNICSKETKSAIALVCLNNSLLEKAGFFHAVDLTDDLRAQLDKAHFEKAKKSVCRESYDDSKRSIHQLRYFREQSEKDVEFDLAKSFEEDGNLDSAHKMYHWSSVSGRNTTDDRVRVLLKAGDKKQAAHDLWMDNKYGRAEKIYGEMGDYRMAVKCLIHQDKIDDAITLARKHHVHEALIEAWEKKNRRVAYSLRDRPQRKAAKSIEEIFANSEQGFVERVLRKGISPKIDNAARERLEQIYDERIRSIHYGAKDEGGGYSYSERESQELDDLHKANQNLWVGTNRYDKLASYESNDKKRVGLYLKAGDKKRAIGTLRNKVDDLIRKGKIEQAKKIKEQIKLIENEKVNTVEQKSTAD